MTEMTLPLVSPQGRQTVAGSSARAACLAVAGAALLAGLAGRPTPVAAPDWPLLEAPVAQHSAVQVVGPIAPPFVIVEGPAQVASPVVIIDGLAPVAPAAAPRAAAPVRRDGVSDRDGWAREPAARLRRAAQRGVVAPAPAAAKVGVVAPAPATAKVSVKVVPETPASLKGPIAQAAAKYGLPSDILSAALARESANFKDRYIYGYHVDGTGRGIAGIDKKFHPEVSDEQALDPNFAIDWMGQYLSRILRKNGGDIYSALREYNGGINFASDRPGYQGRSVSELTRRHADSIMAHAARAILA